MFSSIPAAVALVQKRLDFTMSTREQGIAEEDILDLIEAARFYGSSSWTTEAATPELVRRRVLRATARHIRNVEGYLKSSSGTEDVQFVDDGVLGIAEFTSDEKDDLRRVAANNRAPQFGTIETYAYDNRPPHDGGRRSDHIGGLYL